MYNKRRLAVSLLEAPAGNAEKGRPLEGRRFRFRLCPAGFRRPNGGLFFVKPYASTRVACYNGLIVQAAINNLLPLFYVILQRDFNVSVERLGMLTAVNFITQLIVDLFAAVFVDRLGWRRCICLSHIFAVGGFVMLSFLPGVIDPYTAVVLSVIVYASGSALIEVMVSPMIEALPSEDKGGQMALLHSFYCWGQLLVVLLSTGALALFDMEISAAFLGGCAAAELLSVSENAARHSRAGEGKPAAHGAAHAVFQPGILSDAADDALRRRLRAGDGAVGVLLRGGRAGDDQAAR